MPELTEFEKFQDQKKYWMLQCLLLPSCAFANIEMCPYFFFLIQIVGWNSMAKHSEIVFIFIRIQQAPLRLIYLRPFSVDEKYIDSVWICVDFSMNYQWFMFLTVNIGIFMDSKFQYLVRSCIGQILEVYSTLSLFCSTFVCFINRRIDHLDWEVYFNNI